MRFRILLPTLGGLFLSASGLSANLLSDPGFETDPVEDAPVTAWAAFGTNVTVELDGDQQSGGTKALKLFQDFSEAENYSGAVQEVPIVAGTKYKLSGLFRNGPDPAVDPADPLVGANFALPKIEWLDEFGVLTAHEDNGRVVLREGSPQSEWIAFELIAVAPTDATHAKIVLLHGFPATGAEGGSSWFDDLDFDVTTDPLPAEKPENLLIDGGFDLDPGANWIVFGNGFFESSDFNAPLRSFRDTSAKMFQTFSGPDTNVSGIYQRVPVTEGVSYLLTGRARNGVGGEDLLGIDNRALLKIEWLDASDMQIADTAIEDAATGQIDEFTTPGIWRELAVAGVAPVGAAKAQVLMLHVAEGTAGGGSSWFDDLCFQEGSLPVPPSVEIVSIIYAAGEPGTITVEWTSDSNCTYDLEKSPDGVNWSPVAQDVLDNGGLASAADNALVDPAAFYRVLKFDN